jgi:hypothetical protein
VSSGGFTIIEVMIFLIVTAILLIGGIRVLSGQLTKTAFRQTVNENDAQFKTTMNEVASGFYPNNRDFTCAVVGSTPTFTAVTAGTGRQGENEACIFLGKIVRVGAGGTSYKVYTIVGRRLAAGVEVTKLEDAQPVALARFTGDLATAPDATETFNLAHDLEITKVVNIDSMDARNPVGGIGAFGFLMSVGKSGVGGDLVSGAESVSLIPLLTTTIGGDDPQFKSAISAMKQADLGSSKAIALCIRQGGAGGRVGAIIFGSQGRQLSTEVIIGTPPGEYQCPA